MKLVDITKGDSPIILAMPHSGLHVPADIHSRLNQNGHKLADTDWHVGRLYDGLLHSATIIRANFHRYVIDANRDPSGASLYPGQNTTGLCPSTDFDGAPIYLDGQAPDTAETEQRRKPYHAPYHAAISKEIARIKALHGTALLYDCHSIRSEAPYLFEGALPDFNIGTFSGQSCSTRLSQIAAKICSQAEGYSSVENGRFKGGWTTRHYGNPQDNIHTIQMELAQKNYMEEIAPWKYLGRDAARLRIILKNILTSLETALVKGDAK